MNWPVICSCCQEEICAHGCCNCDDWPCCDCEVYRNVAYDAGVDARVGADMEDDDNAA